MALRQIQPRPHNGPMQMHGCGNPLGGTKGKLAGLQRQALGNMANKQTRNNIMDTKKTFKPRVAKQTSTTVQPGLRKTVSVTSGLAKLTALPPTKRDVENRQMKTRPSQAIKVHKTVAPKATGVPKQQNPPKQSHKMTEGSRTLQSDTQNQQPMDTESSKVNQATHRRTRTLTPQPMDVSEVAGEIQRKLQLVDNIDEEDKEDPQDCAQYIQDIYSYLHQLERDFHPDPSYMARQTKINHKMRAILVDWLVLVQMKFNLLQETLYLTVSIIDRFLEVFPTTKEQLQLIGVTSMYLAAKYEEIYYPQIDDFVYITDNSYTAQQICQMERIILRTLNYNLSPPAPIQFLRRYSKIAQVTARTHTMAKYLMESTLMSYTMIKFLPSQIAASSLALAMELLDDGQWTPTLSHYSGYNISTLQSPTEELAKMALKMPTAKQQAIREKYSNSKFMRVAKDQVLKGVNIKNLATITTQ